MWATEPCHQLQTDMQDMRLRRHWYPCRLHGYQGKASKKSDAETGSQGEQNTAHVSVYLCFWLKSQVGNLARKNPSRGVRPSTSIGYIRSCLSVNVSRDKHWPAPAMVTVPALYVSRASTRELRSSSLSGAEIDVVNFGSQDFKGPQTNPATMLAHGFHLCNWESATHSVNTGICPATMASFIWSDQTSFPGNSTNHSSSMASPAI